MPIKQMMTSKSSQQLAIQCIKQRIGGTTINSHWIICVIASCYKATTTYALPSSLMDSITSIKKKIAEGEGIGAHSLVRNTSRVEGHVGALGWD